MIDKNGFRSNVGIILLNEQGKVFWAKRAGQEAWQFPQGGMQDKETPEQALFRELYEEIGLEKEDVEVLGCTRSWLRYRLPNQYIRFHQKPVCLGQKQKWFLLKIKSAPSKINLTAGEKPEFDDWRWVDYWQPLEGVIAFKRKVYCRALKEFYPFYKRTYE